MIDTHAVAGQALPEEGATMIASAARGDLDAQRKLRDEYRAPLLGRVLTQMNDDVLALCALGHARAAASQGDMNDLSHLASVLILLGDAMHIRARHDVAERARAEAIGVLDRMAETGHETAAYAINELAKISSPGVLSLAKEYAGSTQGKDQAE